LKIRGFHYRTIWPSADAAAVEIIDQTLLPHAFEVKRLSSVSEIAQAIKSMQVRGAPLIGAAAAYGVTLAMQESGDDDRLEQVARILIATRPTAINLRWAVERMTGRLQALPKAKRAEAAWLEAAAICDEDVAANKALGEHGLAMLKEMHAKLGRPLNILTHCNAGWLATVDWGTALAPIYAAFDAGIPLHVWVDETRPRNQGASLTAWELGQHGVPHTVISDNAGGHLMQHGQVDLAIVGADRVTGTGDVCNKIGTYLKALAAYDNGVPFYAAVPSPTIDWTLSDGVSEIPIEERDADEVAWMQGRLEDGTVARVHILPQGCRAANPAFDVTPARLVTGIITERGICAPDQLRSLFPA
jgi:methylthioribose-1-phosphate isomerase